MALKIPVVVTAEYRGVQAGGEFVNDQGEQIAYGPKLKFEVEDENGDVGLMPLSGTQLDKCVPPFDHTALRKGDVVTIGLNVVIGADGERSYMRPTTIAYANAETAKLKAAS